jgi:hypothetical protein
MAERRDALSFPLTLVYEDVVALGASGSHFGTVRGEVVEE